MSAPQGFRFGPTATDREKIALAVAQRNILLAALESIARDQELSPIGVFAQAAIDKAKTVQL